MSPHGVLVPSSAQLPLIQCPALQHWATASSSGSDLHLLSSVGLAHQIPGLYDMVRKWSHVENQEVVLYLLLSRTWKELPWEFPGCLVVRTACFHCTFTVEAQVQSLLWKLRSHIKPPHTVAKKKKKKGSPHVFVHFCSNLLEKIQSSIHHSSMAGIQTRNLDLTSIHMFSLSHHGWPSVALRVMSKCLCPQKSVTVYYRFTYRLKENLTDP